MLSVRIPQDRVGVLIGTHGSTKAEIEKISGLKIDVDSETGEVIIDGTSASDPEMPLKVREVVRAIGRGFSPKKAYRLFDSGVYLEIIDLKDFREEFQENENCESKIDWYQWKNKKDY